MPSNRPQTALGTFGNARMQLSALKENFLGCYDCDRLQDDSCDDLKEGCKILLTGLKDNPFVET
jgi:hypothetical protein